MQPSSINILPFGSRRALLIKLDWNVQPRRANATPMKRRRRSKQGGSQTTGRTSQRNCARRNKTRVGRSSSPRPSRARMARRRRSIWRFRSSAIKTTSRLIVALASFANGARQTPLPIKAVVYAKDFSTRPTLRPQFRRSEPKVPSSAA